MEATSSDVGFEKICVLGLGYIGLPTAAMFATHGFQVAGIGVNDRNDTFKQ